MRRLTIAILLTIGSITFSLTHAAVPAFPGAEGFGAKSVGGRGGRVVEVTNLNDAGTGSLRDALSVQTGPRIVVFRVSGTIGLASTIAIKEANSFVTIAGQTSPGGIQLKGGGIHVRDGGHDVILRYVRIRPGAVPDPAKPGTYIAQNTNAFIAYGNGGKRVYNVIIDHCSLVWSTDQNGPDAWGYVTDYTAQWNITAEGTTVGGLDGAHNTGLIVGANPNITYSIHHSLMAHNHGRNPYIAQSGILDFRNNVIYNWLGNNAFQWGSWDYDDSRPTWCPESGCGSSAKGNVVNNLYLPGPGYSLTNYILGE